MVKDFQDHFSGHAANYAEHRPVYPAALFAEFAARSRGHELVWDVACGNGQAAHSLAEHFARVFASDASAEQLRHAPEHPRVEYACEPAEASTLRAGSVDAVFVGQALHWFGVEAFCKEVRRVARPGAPVVAVLYDLANVTPDIDDIVRAFYRGAIGPFWPGDRRHIDAHYQSIAWPFEAMNFPVVPMVTRWTLKQMTGYLRTWSAVQRYLSAGHPDPLPGLCAQLAPLWGAGPRDVTWPLHRLAGRV
jgi:SAM-dependent methyltransferase